MRRPHERLDFPGITHQEASQKYSNHSRYVIFLVPYCNQVDQVRRLETPPYGSKHNSCTTLTHQQVINMYEWCLTKHAADVACLHVKLSSQTQTAQNRRSVQMEVILGHRF